MFPVISFTPDAVDCLEGTLVFNVFQYHYIPVKRTTVHAGADPRME